MSGSKCPIPPIQGKVRQTKRSGMRGGWLSWVIMTSQSSSQSQSANDSQISVVNQQRVSERDKRRRTRAANEVSSFTLNSRSFELIRSRTSHHYFPLVEVRRGCFWGLFIYLFHSQELFYAFFPKCPYGNWEKGICVICTLGMKYVADWLETQWINLAKCF